jgi:hypothetical protein
MKFLRKPAKIKASFGMTIPGSGYEYLSELQNLYPIVSATDSDRGWWKNMKNTYLKTTKQRENEVPTMKYCPGVFDFTNCGYILPCLFDMMFYVHSKDRVVEWEIPKTIPDAWVHAHEKEQTDSCPIAHGKNTGEAIIKVTTPWFWETPKGWSTIITKPFYNYSNDFDVCPGIIDSDLDHMSNHLINVFLRFNVTDTTIKFRAGQPLCQLIPFERQNTKLIHTQEPDEKGKRLINQGIVRRNSQFSDNPNSMTGKTLLNYRDPSTKNYE